MIIRLAFFFFFLVFFHWPIASIRAETVHGCTINNNDDRQAIPSNKTSVTLSCANNGYILVRNLTFGVHRTSTSTCSYQPGDCTTRTTYIGMECNGLTKCRLDLNPQYLHICSQYSDYMVLDYTCLQGQSLSVCDNRLVLTSATELKHRVFIRSPNYPNEYENALNCSCEVDVQKGLLEFLDFALEERDETDLCSRDYLQIGNRSYCDSTIDSRIQLNSSTQLIFKTNDVITRKGFWLEIESDQPIQISCRNSFESPYPTRSSSTKVFSTLRPSSALLPVTNSTDVSSTRPYTLSLILLVTIIFVVVLLLVNLALVILCHRQRQSRERVKSKMNNAHRSFSCSKRLSSSSSSSITYGETPVLTSLDTQKRQTTSTTTTATGTYEDPNELLIMQKQQHHHPLYLQHRPEPKTFCPIVLPPCSAASGYNRMIHCHLSAPGQTFFPHYSLDSQHVYETIQDGYCAYQRLAATLRRQQQQRCTCSCTYNEQKPSLKTDEDEAGRKNEPNPETLV